jgi:hypothetical protein
MVGSDNTVRQVQVSKKCQINILSDDTSTTYDAQPIGDYGRPRIAVAQADLYPEAGDGIFVKSGRRSIMVSWENVPFFINGGEVNAQAELFANGAVNICYGEGNIPDGESFAAGIEGGGDLVPYFKGDAVAIPLSDDDYFDATTGIADYIWPMNKCYCFAPKKEKRGKKG